MGTRAKCTKCHEEKWVNTTKLKNIHDTQGISPKEWLKTKYVCRKCASRIKTIQNSTIISIEDKLNEFSAECRSILNGLYSKKQGLTKETVSNVVNRLNDKMKANGINGFQFMTYNKKIIGISIEIPIIGKYFISIFC